MGNCHGQHDCIVEASQKQAVRCHFLAALTRFLLPHANVLVSYANPNSELWATLHERLLCQRPNHRVFVPDIFSSDFDIRRGIEESCGEVALL